MKKSKKTDSNKIATLSSEKNKKEYGNISFKEELLAKIKVSSSLTDNIQIINKAIGNNADLVIRNITLGRSKTRDALVIYIDNLIDSDRVDKEIISPLVLDAYISGLNSGDEIIEQLKAGNLITRGEISKGKTFNIFFNNLFAGEVGLFIDGIDEFYVISAKGYNYRDVTESDVEPTVRGSKEAFIEVLSVNIGLIRRRIHNPNLIFESLELGSISKTKICISYIKGVCTNELLEEVKLRINKVDLNGVLEGNYIEEFIKDNPYSVFPQIRSTERPDVVAAALIEGRVALIIDNTPVALIVPGEFFSLMQSAEDYYNGYIFSSLIRFLRYFALAIALLLPSFYIAISNYHQEMIPTKLLISIINARSQVPFPAFMEAIFMEITFEILQEAGVRLPRPIGQAVSIVGALVIGQAAIQANIASPLMVIVVALTGIATFCLPQFNTSLTVRIIRFPLMFLATALGMFGLMLGILFLLLHICSLKSFGKLYMDPIAPMVPKSLKDTLVRFPWWNLSKNQVNSFTTPKKKGDS